MASYRIPNTYQTPIASALGNLMGAFASLPSPEERALRAAQGENARMQQHRFRNRRPRGAWCSC